MNNIYFVLYGKLQFNSVRKGNFGDIINIGWVVGEEILFIEDKVINRRETCISLNDSCLL